jgi:hypothetical protein
MSTTATPKTAKSPKTQVIIVVHNFADPQVLTDTQVEEALPAFMEQANIHFLDQSKWHKELGPVPYEVKEIRLLKKHEKPFRNTWYAQIFNDSQQAILRGRVQNVSDDDFGFHDLREPPEEEPTSHTTTATPPEPTPYIIVLAKTAQDAGVPWTITFSHELLEALADPTARGTKMVGGTNYAFEVCDPVAQQSYPLNKIRVSNFVTPKWYGLAGDESGPYDFLHTLSRPAELAPGGYQTVIVGDQAWTLRLSNGQIQTIPESLTAPGPSPPSRPSLDRAVQAGAMLASHPGARLASVDYRVPGLGNRMGFATQAGVGAAAACGAVCQLCSAVCQLCGAVCQQCGAVCQQCGAVCQQCGAVCQQCGAVCQQCACSGCGWCCGCCGQGQTQAQGGGPGGGGLGNLGFS